jgi:hypothetical protein
MKQENKKNNDISQLGNVDQIREILFGSQSREMKEKFEKVEASLEAIQTEMRKKLEQMQHDFNNKLQSEVDGITRKIKNVTTQQQDEFADLRDSALKQEKRTQNALDILEEELSAKNDQLAKQLTQTNNDLRHQMDMLRDEMVRTLNEKIASLGETKLSRDDAAEILMDAAMQMQGTKINQQLGMTQPQQTQEK